MNELQYPATTDTHDVLVRTIDELKRELSQAESVNYEQALQLRARADESQTDALTGLPNRRAFDRELSARCVTAKRTSCPLTLVFFDIDHFKSVNDTKGHHVGDAVLRGLAQLLKSELPPGAILSRFGGEEFVLVLSGLFIDNAIELVEQMRRSVCDSTYCFEGQSLNISVSCGIAQLMLQEHPEQLLQRADIALYAAKQGGRNRTYWQDGNDLHFASPGIAVDKLCSNKETLNTPRQIIDLHASQTAAAKTSTDTGLFAASSLPHRTTRANWCDGGILYWYIRQRLAEWSRGGAEFCVLAIDVDQKEEIAHEHGPNALHFMMRAQLLHLDSALRESDVVARTGQSRIIVVLPGTTLMTLAPVIHRLAKSMDRFSYPVSSGLVDYSISVGAADAMVTEDSHQMIVRAEAALATAQRQGSGQFFAHRLNGQNELSNAEPLLQAQPVG